jgi:hypothetical protein
MSCYLALCPTNKFFQLEISSIVLDGHRDSVNAMKFNDNLSMLISGGRFFVCLPFRRLAAFQTTLVA